MSATNIVLYNPNTGTFVDLIDLFKPGNSGIQTNFLIYDSNTGTYKDLGTLFAALSANPLSFNTNVLTNTNTYTDLNKIFDAQSQPVGTYSISNNNEYIKITRYDSSLYSGLIFEYTGLPSSSIDGINSNPSPGICNITFTGSNVYLNYLVVGGGGGGSVGSYYDSSNYSAGIGGGGGGIIYDNTNYLQISGFTLQIQVGYPGGCAIKNNKYFPNINPGNQGINSSNISGGNGNGGNSYYGTNYITVPIAYLDSTSIVSTPVYCGNGGGGGTLTNGGSPGGTTGGIGGGSPNLFGVDAMTGYNNNSFYYGNGGGAGGVGGDSRFFNNGGNGSNGVVMIWSQGNTTLTNTTCTISNANSYITTNFVKSSNYSAVIFEYNGIPSTSDTSPSTPGNCNVTFTNSVILNYLIIGGGGGSGKGKYNSSTNYSSGTGGGGAGIIYDPSNSLQIPTNTTFQIQVGYPGSGRNNSNYWGNPGYQGNNSANVLGGNGNGGNSFFGTNYITVPFAYSDSTSIVSTYVYCGNGGGGGTSTKGGSAGSSIGGIGGGSPYLYGISAISGYNINSFYYGNGGGGGAANASTGTFNAGAGSHGVVMIWSQGNTTLTNSTCTISDANSNITTNFVKSSNYSAIIFEYKGIPSTYTTTPTSGTCSIQFNNEVILNYLIIGGGGGGGRGTNYYSYYYAGTGGGGAGIIYDPSGSLQIPANTIFQIQVGYPGGSSADSGRNEGGIGGKSYITSSLYDISFNAFGGSYGTGHASSKVNYSLGGTSYFYLLINNKNVNYYGATGSGGGGGGGAQEPQANIESRYGGSGGYYYSNYVNPNIQYSSVGGKGGTSYLKSSAYDISFNAFGGSSGGGIDASYDQISGSGGNSSYYESTIQKYGVASGGGGGGGGGAVTSSSYSGVRNYGGNPGYHYSSDIFSLNTNSGGKGGTSYMYFVSANGAINGGVYSLGGQGGGDSTSKIITGSGGIASVNPVSQIYYLLNGYTLLNGGGGGGGGGALTSSTFSGVHNYGGYPGYFTNINNNTITNNASTNNGSNGGNAVYNLNFYPYYGTYNNAGRGGNSYYVNNNLKIIVPFIFSYINSEFNTQVYCGNGGAGGTNDYNGFAGKNEGGALGQAYQNIDSNAYPGYSNNAFYYGNGGGGGSKSSTSSGFGASGVVMMWAFGNTTLTNSTTTISNAVVNSIKYTYVTSANYSAIIFENIGNNSTNSTSPTIASCNLTFINSVTLNYLIIGGGGGGLGNVNNDLFCGGSGGGGGGIIYDNRNSLQIPANTLFTIAVGCAGGGVNGNTSTSTSSSSIGGNGGNSYITSLLYGINFNAFGGYGGRSFGSSTTSNGGNVSFVSTTIFYNAFEIGGGGGGGGAPAQVSKYYSYYVNPNGGSGGSIIKITNVGQKGSDYSNNGSSGNGGNSYYINNNLPITIPFTNKNVNTVVYCGNGGGGGTYSNGGRSGNVNGGVGGGNTNGYGETAIEGYVTGGNTGFYYGNGGGGSSCNILNKDNSGNGSGGVVMLWWKIYSLPNYIQGFNINFITTPNCYAFIFERNNAIYNTTETSITFNGSIKLNYLIIGGGGGGGQGLRFNENNYSGTASGGGGGGGGIIYDNTNSLQIPVNTTLKICVGGGGAGNNNNTSNTSQSYIGTAGTKSYITSTFNDISFNALGGYPGGGYYYDANTSIGNKFITKGNGGDSFYYSPSGTGSYTDLGGGGGAGGLATITNLTRTSLPTNNVGINGNSYYVSNNIQIIVPFAYSNSNSIVTTNVYCGNGGSGGRPYQIGSAGGATKGVLLDESQTPQPQPNAISGYLNNAFYYGNGGGGGNGSNNNPSGFYYYDQYFYGNSFGGNGSNGVVMIWSQGNTTLTNSTCTISDANSYITTTFVKSSNYSAIIFEYNGIPSTSDTSPPTPGNCNVTFTNDIILNYLIIGGGGGGGTGYAVIPAGDYRYRYTNSYGGGGAGIIYDTSNSLQIPANTTFQIQVGYPGGFASGDSTSYIKGYKGAKSYITSTQYDISFNALAGNDVIYGGNSTYWYTFNANVNNNFVGGGGGGGGGGGNYDVFSNSGNYYYGYNYIPNLTTIPGGKYYINSSTTSTRAGGDSSNTTGSFSYYGLNNSQITVPFANSDSSSIVSTNVYCGNGAGGGTTNYGGASGSSKNNNRTFSFFYGNGGGGCSGSGAYNGGDGSQGVVMIWAQDNTTLTNSTCTISNANSTIKTTFVSTTGGTTNYSGIIFDYIGDPRPWSGNAPTSGICNVTFANSVTLNYLIIGGGGGGGQGMYYNNTQFSAGSGGGGAGIIYDNTNSLQIPANTIFQIQVGYHGSGNTNSNPIYTYNPKGAEGDDSFIKSSYRNISYIAGRGYWGGAYSYSAIDGRGGSSTASASSGNLTNLGGGGGGGGGALGSDNLYGDPSYGRSGGKYNNTRAGENGYNSSGNVNPQGSGDGGKSYYVLNNIQITVPFGVSLLGPNVSTNVYCGNAGGGGVLNYGGTAGNFFGGGGGKSITAGGDSAISGYLGMGFYSQNGSGALSGFQIKNSEYYYGYQTITNDGFYYGDGGGGSYSLAGNDTTYPAKYAGSGANGVVMIWWYK